MSARRIVLGAAVCTALVIPILIGASCPPPSAPGIYSLVTDNRNLTVLPPCNTGFVCIIFTNSTTISVTGSLYRHNGFDPTNKCPSSFENRCCGPLQTGNCPCPCAGATTGDCRLSRDDLFTGCSLDPPYLDANFSDVVLAPTQSAQRQVRCGDAKTLGATVARATTPAVIADAVGPIYRDEAGGVRCGGTVQFLIVDLNETTAGSGGQDLVTLAIQPQFSQ